VDADLGLDVARLQDAVARTGAALLALEQDPTLQLLDAATLSGQTAAQWTEVVSWRAALFQAHRALSDVVERASAGRRAEDAVVLLRGPSIVLSDVTRPVAERGLLDDSRRVERSTPDQLLEEMAETFARARAVVTAVERIWADAVPWIRGCRDRLAGVAAEAAVLHTTMPRSVDGVDRELDALAETVLSDPLVWSPDKVVAIDARLVSADEELATIRSVRDDWVGQLDDARGLLAALTGAVAQWSVIVERTACRVAGAPPSRTDDPVAELAAELDALAAEAGAVPWTDTARSLADWRNRTRDATSDFETEAGAHQSLLDERAELRGRLDAYEAKAGQLHRLEDSELASLRRRAHDALYTAPTDLAEAGELVRRYGEALREGTRR
jgi:hypothetical protein